MAWKVHQTWEQYARTRSTVKRHHRYAHEQAFLGGGGKNMPKSCTRLRRKAPKSAKSASAHGQAAARMLGSDICLRCRTELAMPRAGCRELLLPCGEPIGPELAFQRFNFLPVKVAVQILRRAHRRIVVVRQVANLRPCGRSKGSLKPWADGKIRWS